MKDTLSKLVIFVAGAAIGSAVTWKLVKTKYEQIAKAEIESVKEVYSVKSEKAEAKKNDPEPEPEVVKSDAPQAKYSNEKPDIREYAQLIKNEGYSVDYSEKSKKSTEEPAKVDPEDRPYSIKPNEYGEFTDYEEVELMYYADGYLADDMDCLVDDIDGTVGFDFADYIGEYEDDVAYIRNDKLKCDYCIDISLKRFKDIVSDDYPLGVEEE